MTDFDAHPEVIEQSARTQVAERIAPAVRLVADITALEATNLDGIEVRVAVAASRGLAGIGNFVVSVALLNTLVGVEADSAAEALAVARQLVANGWDRERIVALRKARAMSVREFAEHLGITGRMVLYWVTPGSTVRPTPKNQEVLNTSLYLAGSVAWASFIGQFEAEVVETAVSSARRVAQVRGSVPRLQPVVVQGVRQEVVPDRFTAEGRRELIATIAALARDTALREDGAALGEEVIRLFDGVGEEVRQRLLHEAAKPIRAADTEIRDSLIMSTAPMLKALSGHDIAGVYRLLQDAGFSQRRIAAAVGCGKSEISEVLSGRKVTKYDVLVRIADGLGVPRGLMGLASS